MKKFLLTLLSLIAVAVAYAANYSVTVTTQQQIEYRDKDGNLVSATTAIGNSMVFEVVADTPRQAEDLALERCQGACQSGIATLAQSGVNMNGKICNKYVRVVPWKAEAKLN